MSTEETEKTTPAKRVPRDSESITKGALSLPLQERVDLVKELQASIATEVSELKASADRAASIASVLTTK